jgi:hypothetical protein
MTMAAFRRFDPYAALVADYRAVAGVASVARVPPDISAADAPSQPNQDREAAPATVATVATVAEHAAPGWGAAEEERAAIVEHDGGIPRAWAEGFARLDPSHPPADVPLRRWQQFIDDVERFLDGPFCAVAIKLGWRPYDLFGCDRDRPYARIDQCGLLWFLDGHNLVELREDVAIVETRPGMRQTYRRKPSEPGRVLAWELVQLVP